MPYYDGALKEFVHLPLNDFMYWELMRYAASHGYKIFRFGEANKVCGSYHFKRYWGRTKTDSLLVLFMHYSSLWESHNRKRSTAEKNIEQLLRSLAGIAYNGQGIPGTSSANPKIAVGSQFWRGLPLRVIKSSGPYIVRHVMPKRVGVNRSSRPSEHKAAL